MEFLLIAIPTLAGGLVIGFCVRRSHRRRLLQCERRTRLLVEAIRQGI